MERWSAVPADTTPDAHEAQAEAYRRMGGKGRIALAFGLTDMARRNTEAGIRRRHPGYDDAQLRRALARLVLGDALTREVWPGQELIDP